MITTCTGCHTRYRLDDARIPRRLIRVRCPECQSIFMLDGTRAAHVDQADHALDLEKSPGRFQFDKAGPDLEPAAGGVGPGTGTGSIDVTVAKPKPPTWTPPDRAKATAEISAERGGTASAEASPQGRTAIAVEEASSPQRRRSRDKTAMLARALVSDILVYNQGARDKALKDGNLLEVLGPEIKKSWELYKEKVTPEVANKTSHFRDALNDILAKGQKIF